MKILEIMNVIGWGFLCFLLTCLTAQLFMLMSALTAYYKDKNAREAAVARLMSHRHGIQPNDEGWPTPRPRR